MTLRLAPAVEDIVGDGHLFWRRTTTDRHTTLRPAEDTGQAAIYIARIDPVDRWTQRPNRADRRKTRD